MTNHPIPIVLTTINATYQHCAFGLRYLYANLGELQAQAKIVEFTLQQKPRDVVETLLSHQPKIIGIGVYIWNTALTLEVVSILKKVAPEVCVILGGPEVSYEIEGQELYALADFVVAGEGEHVFKDLCTQWLRGESIANREKICRGPLPEIDSLKLPYRFYTDEDLKHRILYVEASRGCPYRCEFCLSSRDTAVRNFPLKYFLDEIDLLIERGARQFKFVDRTFNLSPSISVAILDFFLARINRGLFLHFELVPDRLPDPLKERIKQFPAGTLQFEIGIQTWNPDVAALVSRRQNYSKVIENFRFLTKETGVHLHADLIVGLPGETLESFARGFDALTALGPHEVQVGVLKRLKGTPILRHDAAWKMVYQTAPPYTVLQTSTLDFSSVQLLERFSKFWDLYVNSGNFTATMEYFLNLNRESDGNKNSYFWKFWEFSLFLNQRHPQRYAIALVNLVESAWRYFTKVLPQPEAVIRDLLIQDYTVKVKRDVPAFLTEFKKLGATQTPAAPAGHGTLWRQQRHAHGQQRVLESFSSRSD